MISSKSRRGTDRSAEIDPLLEWLAWLMDESIRIGPWSVGLDGFIGLVPGLGDVVGAAVSGVIVAWAVYQGIPRSAVIRMVINIGIDSLLGAVPIAGDVFDFAFKSNVRNLKIYREAIRGERDAVRDWAFIILIGFLTLTVIALPILALVYLAKLLIK